MIIMISFYVLGSFYDEDYDEDYDYDDNYVDTVYGSKKDFPSSSKKKVGGWYLGLAGDTPGILISVHCVLRISLLSIASKGKIF